MFNDTIRGTPQGGLLSPLLANIALNGLEEYLNITYKEAYKNNNGKIYTYYISKGDYRVVRYADDLVIFAKTKEDILKVRDILEPYLKERGLELAEDKTSISHTHDGFNFLGFVRRARGFIPHTVSVKQFVSIPVALGFSPMKLLIE